MTTVLRPPRVCAALNALPLIGALAIARTARASLGIQAFVRWPNDVVLNNRKVAGVLVETRFEGDRLEFALLGLGINANFHTSQLRDLAEKSVTLMDACGSPIQRAPFISSLLQEVEEIYDLARLGKTAYILRWVRQLDWSRGKRVVIRLGGSTSTGIMDGYESLTKIRLVVKQRSLLTVETDSVIAVDYVDA